jgi:hypothetical protein
LTKCKKRRPSLKRPTSPLVLDLVPRQVNKFGSGLKNLKNLDSQVAGKN